MRTQIARYSRLDERGGRSHGRGVPTVITSKSDLAALLSATHAEPHGVLGMHPHKRGRSQGVVVRALLCDAVSCAVVELDANVEAVHELKRMTDEGFFEGFSELIFKDFSTGFSAFSRTALERFPFFCKTPPSISEAP